MLSINPYLNFNGKTEEAFLFYKSVFGGEFGMLQRFSDIPSENPIADIDKNRIMHVSLPIGSNLLMGSDRHSSMGDGIQGNHFTITVNTDSEESTDKIFNGLSTEGTITMPLEKTFWGAYFGMLTDKFGIQWMISYEKQNA